MSKICSFVMYCRLMNVTGPGRGRDAKAGGASVHFDKSKSEVWTSQGLERGRPAQLTERI